MDSNEEYLDQLLKSLTGEDSSGAVGGTDDSDQDDGLRDLLNQFSDDTDNVPEDLLSGLLGTPMPPSEEQPDIAQEESGEEPVTIADMLQDMAGEEETEEEGADEAKDILPEMPPEEETEDIMEQQPVFEEPAQADFEVPETSDIETSDAEVFDTDISDVDISDADISDAEDFDTETFDDVTSGIESSDAEESDSFAMEMNETPADDMEEDDLGSLLNSLGADGDEDAREISDLLNMADRDEPIDNVVDSLMQGMNQETSQDEGYSGDDFLGEDAIDELLGSQEKKKKKKEKKLRRGKKKKGVQELAADLPEDALDLSEDDVEFLQQEEGKESAGEEKKQGFWGKLLNALIQEEEDEEDPSDLVSDENGEILKELEKEKKQAKGKKKKKGKDKKAAEADEDEDFEDTSDAKQKKKKKEKKPKKEKAPVPVEELAPGKKLSLKKVLPLVAVLLVFCLAYVMVSHLYINYVNKQRAEDAYYAGDYMECYGLLLGQDLNDSQELMFHRSELVLQMERMKGNYRRLVMEGKELEALDYLVQCVCRREDTYLQGQEWNSLDVVEEAYAGMMGLLTANYGLTEEQAREIAALKKDEDYTLALLQVLEGVGSDSSGDETGQQDQPVSYEDLLPEEEEDSSSTFVDTLG